jgi:Flp pilus assembly protein TadB
VLAAAYGGFVLPTVLVERATARRRAAADGALVSLIEWTEALVASGRPVETALLAVAAQGLGAPLVDDVLASASRSYALGAPLFPSLAREADRAGLAGLVVMATELERARDLGRGALTVLRDERERLRASERARSLDAAGQVEGKLMLVLVLCYLPALMLLVVIPLFVGILEGLFV